MRRLSLHNPTTFSPSFLLLLAILAVALALRLYGINWDSGFGFHPDERSIYMRAGCMYDVLTEAAGHQSCLRDFPEMESGIPGLKTFFNAERSSLNPHWFPLGSVLIYVLVLSRSVIELFTNISALDMRYVGRPLSALFDVGTVFMVFLLGRKMFSQKVGLLGAAFTALAVIHIQNSHFYRPETISAFFLMASFWAMLRMVERGRLRDSLLLGALVGLAMAPKVSVLPLVLPLGLAYLWRVLDSSGGRWSAITLEKIQGPFVHAYAAGAVALAVFFVLTPYALLDFNSFIEDLVDQTDMARQAGLWPFTYQYVNTPAFSYQIHQTSAWGLGIPLGIVAWLAIPFAAVMIFRRQKSRRWDLLLLAWVVPNLLFLESFEVKFLRYLFSVMPFMVLMAARMLWWLVDAARSSSRSYSASPSSQGAGTSLRWLAFLGRFWVRIWGPLSHSRARPGLALALLVLVLATTAFYALAFERVYARDHPAVAASRWMQENIPPRTAVVSDNHWDEFVPGIHRYDVWQFPVYEPDSRTKMEDLAKRLARSDYLVFYSNRPYGSVARLPEHFPLSSGYYHQLFSGELGYRLERSFTSYPTFLKVSFQDDPFDRAGLPRPQPLVPDDASGLRLNLGYADDNVVGYDHPQVLLFRNLERKPEDVLLRQLLVRSSARDGSGSAVPAQARERGELGLMLSTKDLERQRAGGTWSRIFDRGSWTNRFPVLAWLLTIELGYLITLPLAMFIFRPLPDRGIVLARILGFLLIGYFAWLLVSLDWLNFSNRAIFIGGLLVGLGSAIALVFNWREIIGFLRERWKLLLLAESLFLLAFLAFVLVRMANPDLWHPSLGGEKPMELAYLSAVARSTTLPPYDPWFAGGYLNYYYWGYFLVSLPMRVTGIVPPTAFNLAVPLFFALTFTGAFSLVYNLAEGLRRSRGPGAPRDGPAAGQAPLPASTAASSPEEAGLAGGLPGSPPVPKVGQSDQIGFVEPESVEPESGDQSRSRLAGLLSATMVPLIGNLDGMVRLAQGAWYRRSRFASTLWSPIGAGLLSATMVAVIGNLDGMVQLVQGAWYRLFRPEQALPLFDFWRSSRMIPPLDEIDGSPLAFWLPAQQVPGLTDVSHHITEFPFFTFLFADLHAHMMALPFTLLVMGLGVSLAVGLRNSGWRWTVIASTVLALGLGSLWVINSWDYPAYLVLVLALLGLAAYGRRVAGTKKFAWTKKLGWFGLLSVGVIGFSVLLFLPFHQTYETFNAGIAASKWRTPLDRYLVIHGLFLFVAMTFLIYRGRQSLAPLFRTLSGQGDMAGSDAVLTTGDRLRLAYLGIGLAVVVYLALAGYWTAAILLPLLLLTGLALMVELGRETQDRLFAAIPLIFLGMALSIGIGVDFVRLNGDIGRMNTLFKLYLEGWVLFSVAAGYMLWYLGDRGWLSRIWSRDRWGAKLAWMGILAVLLASSLIYPVLGTKARINVRFGDTPVSLEGTAYMAQADHQEEGRSLHLKWDLEAIRWLQDNVEGSPVILEAHHHQYHWTSRVADYTGLPTVLGWPWHQIQQRTPYAYAIQERSRDIREIYSTADVGRAQELLTKYDIEYIVVGELEQAHYPAAGLDKFEQMVGKGLVFPEFRNQGVNIYRVLW